MEPIGQVTSSGFNNMEIKWKIQEPMTLLSHDLEISPDASAMPDDDDSTVDSDASDDGTLRDYEKKFISPSFTFAGASWHFSIEYTVKRLHLKGGFFLCRETFGNPIAIECTVLLKIFGGTREREIKHVFVKGNEKRGLSRWYDKAVALTRITELTSYGAVSVHCSLKGSESTENVWYEKLSNDLKEMMLNTSHSDTTIKVKGEEFRLHKNILTARCPFFDAMFKTDMKEKTTGVVTIDDCEPDIFRSFIHFVYTGKVDKFTSENVCQLYEVADKYQENQFKKQCLDFMLNTISVDNFYSYIALALKHDEKELFQNNVELFSVKAKEIVRSVNWETFMVEYPTQAKELFVETLDHYIK